MHYLQYMYLSQMVKRSMPPSPFSDLSKLSLLSNSITLFTSHHYNSYRPSHNTCTMNMYMWVYCSHNIACTVLCTSCVIQSTLFHHFLISNTDQKVRSSQHNCAHIHTLQSLNSCASPVPSLFFLTSCLLVLELLSCLSASVLLALSCSVKAF